MNEHFNDFWLNGSLQDCGSNCNDITFIDIKFIDINEIEEEIIIPEKLNNNHMNNNNINDDNESDIFTRIKIIEKSNCKHYNNKQSRRKSNESIDNYKNGNCRVVIKKNTTINHDISKKFGTGKDKRQMCPLSENSRIYEFRQEQRQILLDTFSKPRINCLKQY